MPTLQAAIATLPIAALVVDLDDFMLAANRRAIECFDLPPRLASGLRFRDTALSYRVPGLRARLEAVKDTGMAVRMPSVDAPPGVAPMVLAIDLSPIRSRDRRLQAVLICAEDRNEVVSLRRQHATAVALVQEELTTRHHRLQADNEELRVEHDRLEARHENLQVRAETLMASCESLQFSNKRLQARLDELEGSRPDFPESGAASP